MTTQHRVIHGTTTSPACYATHPAARTVQGGVLPPAHRKRWTPGGSFAACGKPMNTLPKLLLLATLSTPVFAADFPAPAPQLKALDAQAGHWVYHGTTTDSATGKTGTFTWDEHCGWSADKLFLMCSFDNDWSGEKAQSLVVDTWNSKDRSYWHYEFFAVGDTGAKPFASKMTIQGNTWTELGEDDDKGKKSYDRISYVYTSATQVQVKIEISPDQKQWKTVLQGAGVKQP